MTAEKYPNWLLAGVAQKVVHCLEYNGVLKIAGKTYHALGEEFYSKADAVEEVRKIHAAGFNARIYPGDSWGKYRIGVARHRVARRK